MNSKLRAILLPILRTVRSGKAPSFRNRSAAEQAIFLLGKPASQRRKKAAAARRVLKVAGHRVDDAALKQGLLLRTAGRCELHPNDQHNGIEPHHLEGGSGRRALQWVGNTMWTCRDGHEAYHRRPEDFRWVVMSWCTNYDYPTPRRFRGEPLTRKAT